MTDVWGQKSETLDGLKGAWKQFMANRQNDIKNMVSLLVLAQANAIPGVNTGYDGFFKRMFQWPFYIFSTRSTKESSWLASTRSLFLDTYKELHHAIAKNDMKTIKYLTSDSFAIDTINTQKKQNTDLSYIWRFHREVNPTQIVSLRCIEAYLATEDPKIGNRLMVHALVKFDTEQSLEIYDRKGYALHQPAQGSTPRDVAVGGPIPAVRRNVVQYFVFEKRMWYDSPWVIREQLWDVPPTKAK
ncbi:hypothetical protein NP233_g6973 [Leucocoprinus birnbaumii]|uniref:Tim44-like domain-containing protein n=1 Tax=Leucocoprinus birnbaumii TaxID=56174 RepID=A0AAD5VQ45_9AGAR|nr:hypothetical protein NP233_g6973 [Leucocoprinus birnbaumii]